MGKKGFLQIAKNQAKKDILSFSELIAEKYFNLTNTMLKEEDPDHLNLGCRFLVLGVYEEVLKKCSEYVDVISINYYRKKIFNPIVYVANILTGCVPIRNWMNAYYRITGKPILVSEFSFAAEDTGLPNKGNIAIVVQTQKQRVRNFEWYATKCQKLNYIIGYHWFCYMDEPMQGRYPDGECMNLGLVNEQDEPYELLVNKMSEVNHRAYMHHNG